MIKYPPIDNLGYKLFKASMVDSYISPSSRKIAIFFIGAIGKVSLNHPFKKMTCSSSKSYRLKFSLTVSRSIASSFLKCKSDVASAGYSSEFGVGSPQKRISYPYTSRFVTVRLQNCSHKNCRSSSPDSCFHKITGNIMS